MKKNVLFICTGNTCRSPMAEGYARKICDEQNIPYEAASAGLFVTEDQANEKAIQTAQRLWGVDLSHHQPQILTAKQAEEANHIITMTEEHCRLLKDVFPAMREKISILSPEGIADPYGGTPEEYQICAKQIEKAVNRLAEEWKNGT